MKLTEKRCPTFRKICHNCGRKIIQWPKEKNSFAKMKLNGMTFPIQADTTSEVSLIARNFWEQMNKPKLRNNHLKLRQFDGSFITNLGYFNWTFKTCGGFEVISMTAVKCKKSQWHVGIDFIKVATSKLIDSIKTENVKLEC